ncbi:hypothetical protein Btru_057374 [Bulinus truncatus]|nr:hypothetical protein Btru_057374 [Bulinus truncatus]
MIKRISQIQNNFHPSHRIHDTFNRKSNRHWNDSLQLSLAAVGRPRLGTVVTTGVRTRLCTQAQREELDMTCGQASRLLSVIFITKVWSDLTFTLTYKDQMQQNTSRQIHFLEDNLRSFQQCVCNSSSVACIFSYTQGTSKTVRYITSMESKVLRSKELAGQLLSYYVCGKVVATNRLLCMRQRQNKTCVPALEDQRYYIDEKTCALGCVGLAWGAEQYVQVDSNVSSLIKTGRCLSPQSSCEFSSSGGAEVPGSRNGLLSSAVTQWPSLALKSNLITSITASQRISTSPNSRDDDEDDDGVNRTVIIIGVVVGVVAIVSSAIIITILWRRYLAAMKVLKDSRVLSSAEQCSNDNAANLEYSQTSLYNDVFTVNENYAAVGFESINRCVISSFEDEDEPAYIAMENIAETKKTQISQSAVYSTVKKTNKSTLSVTTMPNAVGDHKMGDNPDSDVSTRLNCSDNLYSKLGHPVRGSANPYDTLSRPEMRSANEATFSSPNPTTASSSKDYSLAQPI